MKHPLLLLPFDPDRKLMTVALALEHQPVVLTKGAVELLLNRSRFVVLRDGVHDLDELSRREILDQENAFAEAGFRVLGFGLRRVALDRVRADQVEQDMVFSGMVALADPIRAEVADAIQKCRQAGIRVIMITGDHRRTAAAVARTIGLIEHDALVYDGSQLDMLFLDDDLRNALLNGCRVFARTNPRQKLRVVQVLRSMGEVLAVRRLVVGRGPALRALPNSHDGMSIGDHRRTSSKRAELPESSAIGVCNSAPRESAFVARDRV